MARKINFRSKVAESLGDSDASTFQELITNKLNEKLNLKKVGIVSKIVEENSTEAQLVNQINATASSFGGNDAVYDMGVMDIRFDNAQAAQNFAEQLDNLDGIDYYEISEPTLSQSNDTGGTDLEYQGTKPVYEVTVYLDLDNVSLVPDIDSYMDSLESFDEACKSKKKKVVSESSKNKKENDDEEAEKSDEEFDDESEDEEFDDESEDEESEDKKGCKANESLKFDTIFDKVSLHEFLTVKTAHWSQALKHATSSTDTVCPPGRTGADCKTVLTAQQKMALRKRMTAHLKKLTGKNRSRMATHGAATRAFIQQHNLMTKASAKAKLNK